MTLMKSALLASATTLVAVAGAQAADLPSKKAAPVSYVKVCDAYGAGFFYIPGTDTCVKIGGYVRAEYQYVPGKDTYTAVGWKTSTVIVDKTDPTKSAVDNKTGAPGALQQSKKDQSETGYEVRGRIDIDARTPTAMGPARTFVRLRGANNSGVRNTAALVNFGGNTDKAVGTGYSFSDASATTITVESAMIQWAGFTFGVGPENYAMMPATQYHANPWAGFPSGMKQLAYTANFGGGLTATLALEDRRDFPGYDSTVSSRPATAGNIVGNVRLDQAWGFAAVHGMVGNNSVANKDLVGATGLGQKTYSAWAIGTTASFKLPMISAGDQLWINANYTDGLLGTLLSGGGLSTVNRPANGRFLGGLLRNDASIAATGVGAGTPADPYQYDNVTAWNVGAQFTHYWTSQWRSNLVAGYVEVNPPTRKATSSPAWGKGQLQVYTASLIYSPVRDLDIGLEVQYASLKNKLQDAAPAQPGLNANNIGVKFRVERAF